MKFSTRETREEGKGWFVIQEHLRRLQHVSHVLHPRGGRFHTSILLRMPHTGRGHEIVGVR